MLFGKKLCSISQDGKFINKLWEQMKPYLEEIAADRHPKGCFITVVGPKQWEFHDAMLKIMQAEAIVYKRSYLHPIDEYDFYMALWDESGITHAGSTLRYEDLSDTFLEIRINYENEFGIYKRKLADYQKSILKEKMIFCLV